MTPIHKPTPCQCGNDDLAPHEGMSSAGPAFVVRCDDCGTQGWTDESPHGAVDYWNAGKRVMRADW